MVRWTPYRGLSIYQHWKQEKYEHEIFPSKKMDDNKNTQLFMGLCTSLVTQARMQLGKIKNPMTDKIENDLDAASLTIDMLGMLKEKTKGNISDDETKILDQSINELRMNYIISKDNKESENDEKDNKESENEKKLKNEEKKK